MPHAALDRFDVGLLLGDQERCQAVAGCESRTAAISSRRKPSSTSRPIHTIRPVRASRAPFARLGSSAGRVQSGLLSAATARFKPRKLSPPPATFFAPSPTSTTTASPTWQSLRRPLCSSCTATAMVRSRRVRQSEPLVVVIAICRPLDGPDTLWSDERAPNPFRHRYAGCFRSTCFAASHSGLNKANTMTIRPRTIARGAKTSSPN